MPAFPSVAAAIDKARLASADSFVALLEIDVLDRPTGAVLSTLRVAHSPEAFIHRGLGYAPVPFDFQVSRSKGEMPTLTVSLTDARGELLAALLEESGGADFPVRVKITSTAAPDAVEREESFRITETRAAAEGRQIELTLGAENPLALRFPFRPMFRDRCFWRYRSPRCGYQGPLPSCDFTRDGPNGCAAHANLANFGGFPGMRRGSGL